MLLLCSGLIACVVPVVGVVYSESNSMTSFSVTSVSIIDVLKYDARVSRLQLVKARHGARRCPFAVLWLSAAAGCLSGLSRREQFQEAGVGQKHSPSAEHDSIEIVISPWDDDILWL
jgi:hypothetical protein